MSADEFTDLNQWAGIINDKFKNRDIDVCYNLAMMTRMDELGKDQHLRMSFAEFLEAEARVANQAMHPEPWLEDGPAPERDEKDTPMWKKLENIMPKLIM